MKILATQMYGRGETPVFIAFLDTESGEPVNPSDYSAITVSHERFAASFSGKARVELEKFSVPLESLLAQPVESVTAFEGTSTEPFPYNFIFLPVSSINFYPEVGAYRTLFEFQRKDGLYDTLVFESQCVTKFSPRTLNQGEIPTFSLRLSTKQIVNAGSVQYSQDGISRIVMQVQDMVSGRIVSETEIPPDKIEGDLLTFTPETTIFPNTGKFIVRFLLEHADGSPNGVAEMEVRVE